MRLRRLETGVLVLVGVVLVVAVGHDVLRRAERIHSFRADARALRHYVHRTSDRSISRPRFFRYPAYDTACADAGFDGAVRLCLQLRRTDGGVRPVGGWRAPTPSGDPGPRFGCFGVAERRNYCHPATDPSGRAEHPS